MASYWGDRWYLKLLSQVPLKELLVYHPDEKYLADVKPLRRYIESELNIQDVVLSSDETLSGVRYRAVADWATLGQKLRKDLGRVKNALPNVTSDAVKAYIREGKISVDGVELVTGDLSVQRYLELPSTAEKQYDTNTDNDVVVRLDIQSHPELQAERLTREFTNRVQKLRKKAGLQATDDVHVYYRFWDSSGTEILAALEQHAELIQKTVGSLPVDIKERKPDSRLLIEEEQDILKVKFVLYLVEM